MKIVIIGGSGFVSGTLARKAVELGHQVWAVTRGQRAVPDGVRPLTADRTDETAFALAVEKAAVSWDLAVDCIGYNEQDAGQDLRVLAGLASHLVFVSTDFVYDPARRVFPQTEDADGYLTEGYGGGKRAAERVFQEQHDTDAWTVVRPCHIYGPGSRLGCLPEHSRDPDLLHAIRSGRRLRLIGGGHFLQQPIFVDDLTEVILSIPGRPQARRAVFNVAGPDTIESRRYYGIIAEVLGVPMPPVDEIPVAEYLRANPTRSSFLCHRIYDFARLVSAGIGLPSTPVRDGLRRHVEGLIASG